MFKQFPNGSSMIIGEEDLALEVYIPPVGYVWNHDTKKLEPSEIISRSSVESEQYWERPKMPKDYTRRAVRERELQKTDPEYIDYELKEYRAREWYRRLYGVWFMNNGIPIYLTGSYYFYLAHWTLDVGPPKFKMADLHKAYFWDYCVEDPCCYGMVEMTKRRVGKSFFSAAMLYEYVSRTSNAHAGIQSKTGPDAKLVFSEKLIQPWRKLIDIFRPDYDTSKGDVPKTELRFFKTARKGSKVINEYDEGAELESWIDFLSSETHAYDSQKMLRYLCDEVFKTTEVDIIKRHAVVKPCLENENGEIIGKAIYTSTVEEMEGFLELYLKLWNDSNINERDDNGRTRSGLYRFFTAAQKIMYVDKYGIPDEERALQQIENTIKSLEDPRDIADYIRKNPRNYKEAFGAGTDNCLFNPIKLKDRLAILNFKKEDELFKRYNLVWDDVPEGEIPKVIALENKNGRYRFANGFLEKLGNTANDVIRRGSQFLPKNNLRFVIGIDPYDHNRTKDNKFSQGAAAVFMKYDPFDPDFSDNFVAYYIGRPSSSVIFYEDMVKLCHFISCQMLFEDNKPKIQDHFVDRGYGHFMVRDEKGHAGISGTQKSHQTLAEHIEICIEENCHRVIFPAILTDWMLLDLDDTTKSDLAMATGYALIAASRILRKEKLINKLNKTKSASLVRRFKIKTGYAKRLRRLSGSSSKFSKSLY